MAKKLVVVVCFLLIFLYTTHTNAQDFKYVEIFDPKQDAVVKVVQLNPQIQSIIANWVKNIDGIYGKNNPRYAISSYFLLFPNHFLPGF